VIPETYASQGNASQSIDDFRTNSLLLTGAAGSRFMTEARIFECGVCGAPAHAGDINCRFCGAGIATRCCTRCFHMNMGAALHCAGCGAELGLMSEFELSANLCADCQLPMVALAGSAGTVLDCQRCGGQFVEHALLRSLIEERESAAEALPEAPYRRQSKASFERVHYRPCAVCQQMMNRKNFGGASGVIVDVCAKHGTWFDAGELPQVLQFVQTGGLVRERLRQRELPHGEPAHESAPLRELAPGSVHWSSHAIFRESAGAPSFAKDLLAFISSVLRQA
jgi:Zn-finger nucleic acid-binding protein